MSEGMSSSMSFHQAPLGPTGAHWLDDPPDLSSKDSTRQYAVDDPRLSCKQQVGGSSPPASSDRTVLRLSWLLLVASVALSTLLGWLAPHPPWSAT